MIASSAIHSFTLTIIILQSSSFRLEFDDYESNPVTEYPCFGIGTRCDMTPECCRPATCVLPAWSPLPVCLVSGYKRLLHDLDPDSISRTKDILNIKQRYNTSFFDHLLTSISTPTPLENIDSGSSTNDTSEYYVEYNYFRNRSNNTEYEDVENSTTNLISNSGLMVNITSQSSDKLISGVRLDSTPIQMRYHMKNQKQFLIIKSTVESSTAATVIGKFNDTDRFKEVVILLEEKLKWLNQNENNQTNTFIASMENKNYSSPQPSSFASSQTSPKESKWNLVKAYFLGKENNQGDSDVLSTESPTVLFTTAVYNNSSYQDQDDTTFQDAFIENIDSDERIKEAFRKLYSPKNLDDLVINNYDSINKVIDIDNETGISNENIVEVYNIDIPGNIDQQNETDVLINKDETEQIFSTITKTLGSLPLNVLDQDSLQNTSIEETTSQNKVQLNEGLQRTSEAPNQSSEHSHFWQKIYLWPVHGNVSEKITKELKSWFRWKKRSNSHSRRKSNLVLNEKVILHFNSKNHSKHINDYPSTQSEKPSSDYTNGYSSSVESASSEDLYNSSYVFVVHKDNSSAAVGGGKWKSILNMFHISNMIHSSATNKSSNIPRDPSNSKTEEHNVTDIQRLVRLPEHLMPEALKEREINETDFWLFEDSTEMEEPTIVEQRSSNSTFLFFFKW